MEVFLGDKWYTFDPGLQLPPHRPDRHGWSRYGDRRLSKSPGEIRWQDSSSTLRKFLKIRPSINWRARKGPREGESKPSTQILAAEQITQVASFGLRLKVISIFRPAIDRGLWAPCRRSEKIWCKKFFTHMVEPSHTFWTMKRKGSAVWKGGLKDGSGSVSTESAPSAFEHPILLCGNDLAMNPGQTTGINQRRSCRLLLNGILANLGRQVSRLKVLRRPRQ